MSQKSPSVYGLMAEFGSAQALLDAAEKVKAAGFHEIDAYSPYPIEAVSEVVCDHKRSRMPLIVLAGGLLGLLGGFGLEYWAAVIEYPMNIGGRPHFSWPSFVIPAYETTILGASLAGVVGMLFLNGLPSPYHPVFNHKRFVEKASRDGYFLVIKAKDKKFDRAATRTFLEGLHASEVAEVEY